MSAMLWRGPKTSVMDYFWGLIPLGNENYAENQHGKRFQVCTLFVILKIK